MPKTKVTFASSNTRPFWEIPGPDLQLSGNALTASTIPIVQLADLLHVLSKYHNDRSMDESLGIEKLLA
jgi:hypothetical protein